MSGQQTEPKRNALAYLSTIGLVLAGWYVGNDYLNLETLQTKLDMLDTQFEVHPIIFIGSFVATYILVVAFFIPGSFLLNLLAGAILGPLWGIIFATLAATAGSMLGFYISRYVAAGWVRARFPKKSKKFNNLLADGGWMNILMLRIAPALPVGLTNFLAGVTRMPTTHFATATLIGVIPWIAFYVLAGVELASVDSVSDLASPELMALALGLIAIIAIGRVLMRKLTLDQASRPES